MSHHLPLRSPVGRIRRMTSSMTKEKEAGHGKGLQPRNLGKEGIGAVFNETENQATEKCPVRRGQTTENGNDKSLQGVAAPHVGINTDRDEHGQENPADHGEADADGKTESVFPIDVDAADTGPLIVLDDAAHGHAGPGLVKPQIEKQADQDTAAESDELAVRAER